MPPADPLPSLSSAEWQSEAEVTDEENAAQAVVSEIGNTTPPEPEVGCESQRKSKKLLVCNMRKNKTVKKETSQQLWYM